MKEIKIEHLAYRLKQAKDNKRPQPIFFLGAGASCTGDIPLAGEIVKNILEQHKHSPFIKDLPDDKKNYPNLMDCLDPDERNELLKGYIKKAKINVTHIYLAQLLNEGYVDYILTVNFDNLMLRALSLYNIFPATYDMAILKDLTTSTFKEKSVVYLHGQNHGLWLLNTQQEMDKVKTTVPTIFDSIKNGRPWIFIGYSAEDPIFEHIKKLGRFDNGLYWVSYNNNDPSKKVREFLSNPHTNAFLIKGYDADSFMLKLNAELKLSQPSIVDKPFTALKEMLNEIVDIDDKEHFKGVKERLEISKEQVDEAIQQFEVGKITPNKASKNETQINLLKKEIINLLINEKYDEKVISGLQVKAKNINDKEVNSLLSSLYSDWGIDLAELAKTKTGKEAEQLYLEAFKKYQKAIDINPDKHEAYNNWGNGLAKLAKTKTGNEAEQLYLEAFKKYQKAIDINPDMHEAYYNWGIDLAELAKTKTGNEAEQLYLEAFKKYQKAIDINPDMHEAYYNWGNGLAKLAKTKTGKEAEQLYLEAFKKYQKAIDINPDKHEAYNNWGSGLAELAKTKTGNEAEQLYLEAFKKYQKAIDINPDMHEAYYNWGNGLAKLAKTKTGNEAEQLYLEAFKKYQKAIDINPDKHEAYNNWGNGLAKLAKTKTGNEAEQLYLEAFKKYQKAIDINPDMHEAYYNWGIDLAELAKTKTGNEAEQLYLEAFKKYQKAIDINPDMHEAYYNWGNGLAKLAKTKTGKEEEDLYNLAFEKYQKSISLGGNHYNLACLYALRGNKKEALHHLDISLQNDGISTSFVKDDEDWEKFLNDDDFNILLNKYDKEE
ncbi:TPR end-of-group domain-containing protein [Flavobacterium litorale]|uniref:SIR2 family protein n=1 Tax=Flavobacterium litorale TaxID=2856519 RepID=A0ABX8V8K5_9FLAO|nr:SIR2 family protein [Flavobacterium litorale]QYJ69180.1 SIR2 family protein [Flavobacterium litorale]